MTSYSSSEVSSWLPGEGAGEALFGSSGWRAAENHMKCITFLFFKKIHDHRPRRREGESPRSRDLREFKPKNLDDVPHGAGLSRDVPWGTSLQNTSVTTLTQSKAKVLPAFKVICFVRTIARSNTLKNDVVGWYAKTKHTATYFLSWKARRRRTLS